MVRPPLRWMLAFLLVLLAGAVLAGCRDTTAPGPPAAQAPHPADDFCRTHKKPSEHQHGPQVIMVTKQPPSPEHLDGEPEAVLHVGQPRQDHIVWCGENGLRFRVVSVSPHETKRKGVKKGMHANPFEGEVPKDFSNKVVSATAKGTPVGMYSYKYTVQLEGGATIDPHIETHCYPGQVCQ